MISLNYPQSTGRAYTAYLNHLIDLDAFNTQSMGIDIFPGFLREARGIYGENGVSHAKAEGTVSYNPSATQFISRAPTDVYPSRIMLNRPMKGPIIAEYGGPTATMPAFHYLSETYTKRSAFKQTEDGGIIARWGYKNSDSTILESFFRYHFTFANRTANSVTIKSRRTQFTGLLYGRTNIDWSTLSAEESFVIPSPGTESVSNSSAQLTVSQVNVSTMMTVQEVIVDLESICAREYNLLNKQKHISLDFGELAMRALESTDYIHTNMISFLKEIPDVKNLIPKLSNLKKLKSLKGIDALSDEYLSAKYGLLPTISDLQEIVKAFQKQKAAYLDQNGFRVATSSHFDTQGEVYFTQELAQRLKIAIGTKEIGLFRLTEQLDHFGVLPNFKNLWDLVPYSFALDWLVDVGSLLERADAQIRIESLPIKYCTRSKKKTRTVSMDALTYAPYGGSFQLVQYHRWVSALAPVPPLSLQAPLSLPQHLLEATALILQRRK